MKFTLRFLRLSIFALFAILPYLLSALPQLPEKAETDKSEYRYLTLDNDLRVILLSDPNLNKSSAALAVYAGSMSDPKDRQGLAHFLEHMLFLGTEKYPDEAEYSNYIRSNGGYSNAYTSTDHTNYMFEVGHHAFEGALDRFSQFFIAPLFSEKFTEREMNAVDSEFEKNLESDGWRAQVLRWQLYNPEHPLNHFSIGNLKTLQGIDRSEFINFYDQHYSANQMALALTGKASLDQLEAYARKYFSAIQNKNIPSPNFPNNPLTTSEGVRVLQIDPIRDSKKLDLVFNIPPTTPHFRSKTAELLGSILGDESRGSLLSYLKQEVLATGLSAGANDPGPGIGFFHISIELTPKGVAQWQEVASIVMSAIQSLKNEEYPTYIFNERKVMAALNELYTDKGEGAGRATFLSSQALFFPLELAAHEPYLYEYPDPGFYFTLLNAMTVENLTISLTSKGLKTNQIEKWFGTPYSYESFQGDFLQSLKNPPEISAISLPLPNPFVPDSVALTPEQPIELINEVGLRLFYSQDLQFLRPNLAYVVGFHHPKALSSPRDSVLKAFYVDVINEMLNETTYAARTAGLSFGIGQDEEGISLSVSGYSQAANRLLDFALKNLTSPDLPEDRFQAIKDRNLRDLANFKKSDAWKQTVVEARNLSRQYFTSPEQSLEIAQSITLDQVKDFAQSLFKTGSIDVLVHGNATPQEAIATAHSIKSALGFDPISEDALTHQAIVKLDPGEAVYSVLNLEVNNSCFRQEVHLGQDNPKLRAAAIIAGNFMAEPYYSEMRTSQQLGYIVASFMTSRQDTYIAGFIIQSADYPADYLQDQSSAFIAELPARFNAIDDQFFNSLIESARAELLEKPKSIAEKAAIFYSLAFDHHENWNRKQETIDALDALTKEDVAQIFQLIAKPQSSGSIFILGYAPQHQKPNQTQSSFSNLKDWKATRVFQ